MEPRVTVLIPVRNGENFLREAIESVLQQTSSGWVLSIRNNASTDGTRAVVEPYLSDRRIRMIDGASPLSMVGNFNECLNLIETEYYMILCHDDYFNSPHAIEKGLAVMEANPSASAVYSDLLYVDRSRNPITPRRFGRSGVADARSLARGSILGMRNMFGIPLLVRTRMHGNHRYDEALPYVADVDLSIITSNAGPVHYIPELLIANRYHDQNNTGVLMDGVLKQMTLLAERHQFALTPVDHLRMQLSLFLMTTAKRMFLIYARYAKFLSWSRTASQGRTLGTSR